MRKCWCALVALLFLTNVTHAQPAPSRAELIRLLGNMPVFPILHVDTLANKVMPGGHRYLIRYLAEDADTVFHTPRDYITAYWFVPTHKPGERLPAILAIHQDGAHNYLGKKEPAGIAGDTDQVYGLELFKRGYLVCCPDRFYHGRRRRIANPDTLADLWNEGMIMAVEHQGGQLLSAGRTTMGKEVYDLERSMDVLCASPDVDTARIGAIGHSAGGNALAYFMFADPRVKVGVSSCGVFELADFFDEHAPIRRYAFTAIPGFQVSARTSDIVGGIAPRPFLMTRGRSEWGSGNGQEQTKSAHHVQMTERLAAEAGKYYNHLQADSLLKTIYFTDGGGRHSFPYAIRQRAYAWLDEWLKPR
jgi:dienelactone hydrolase